MDELKERLEQYVKEKNLNLSEDAINKMFIFNNSNYA